MTERLNDKKLPSAMQQQEGPGESGQARVVRSLPCWGPGSPSWRRWSKETSSEKPPTPKPVPGKGGWITGMI